MPTKIKLTDVKVEGGAVVVRGKGGAALAQSLIQKNGSTLAEFAEKYGLVLPHEITIGSDGAVEINSAKLATKVKGMLSDRAIMDADAGFFDTNCGCGGGTGTSSW